MAQRVYPCLRVLKDYLLHLFLRRVNRELIEKILLFGKLSWIIYCLKDLIFKLCYRKLFLFSFKSYRTIILGNGLSSLESPFNNYFAPVNFKFKSVSPLARLQSKKRELYAEKNRSLSASDVARQKSRPYRKINSLIFIASYIVQSKFFQYHFNSGLHK